MGIAKIQQSLNIWSKFVTGVKMEAQPEAYVTIIKEAHIMKEKSERSRGRPRKGGEHDAEALLEAATICFAEHGFDKTSLRLIAQQAGVDVAMISYRHGSKLGLWTDVVRFVAADSLEQIERIIAEATVMSDRDGMRHLWAKIVEMIMERPHFAQMLIAEVIAGNDGERRRHIIELLALPIHIRLIAFVSERMGPQGARPADQGFMVFSAVALTGLITSAGSFLDTFTDAGSQPDRVLSEMQTLLYRLFDAR